MKFQRSALGVARRAVATLAASVLATTVMAASASADDRHIDPYSLETLGSQVYCTAGKGKVVTPVHNSLPASPEADNSLLVTARYGDDPSAPTDGPYLLAPDGYRTFAVPTGVAQVLAGHVTFIMTWADGSGYNDERGVSFEAKDCRFPVSPVVDTLHSSTCTNPDLVVKGADYLPGLTWDPSGVVTLAQGESVTFNALIDETISRQVGGVSSLTITNDFVCVRPRGSIQRGHGDPSARLDNSRSEVSVRYHAWAINPQGKTVFEAVQNVRVGQVALLSLGGDRHFRAGTVIRLKAAGLLMDRVRIHHR